jgi:hypothetical protein
MSSTGTMTFPSGLRPFHSPRQRIHHRDETCAVGQTIAPNELRLGTGGKDLCPECEELVRAKNGGHAGDTRPHPLPL